MKKLIQKILIVLAIALSVNSTAQTSVDLSYLGDSSSVWPFCPPPIPVSVVAFGNATGYNVATDSITLHYYWGDGSDSFYKVPISTSMFYNFGSYDNEHVYTTPGTYAVKVVAIGPDGVADSMINAPFTISSGCVTIDGYAYDDNNSNCVFDSGDDTLSGVGLMIQNAGGTVIGYAYTNASGYYSTSIPNGLTGLQISTQGSWLLPYLTPTCPVSSSYSFSSTGGSLTFNFGMSCNASDFDLFVSRWGSWIAPPGGTGHISFYARNFSCTPSIPATITLTLDPNVSYLATTYGPAPTSVVGNVLTWNTAVAYGPYPNFNVTLSVLTSTGATLLSPACFQAEISSTPADIYLGNNIHGWCNLIGGPYDPNSKEVSPAGIGAAGEIAPDTELTYTLNFQNTGTAPAINVSVLDTIDTDLDMSTFQIIASSHTMNPEFYNGNIVRFVYPNIMLPDSNANEPMSHGWVVYKIKTKPGLTNGTQLKNTGHIFFDYNAAIVTNTTLNTINMALGVEEKDAKELSTLIYPNPAENLFTIEFGENLNGMLSVIDITGRVVKMVPVDKTDRVSINTQELSSGLYGLSFPGVTLKQNRVQIIK